MDDELHGQRRQRIHSVILGARDLDAIGAAEKLLVEWLDEHPDDPIRTEAEGLQRMKDALRLVATGRGDELNPRNRVLGPEESRLD